MNKVILIGNLGANPELRTTPGGKSVTTFTMATKAMVNDAEPDWHRVEAWEKTAELVAKYMKKGSKIGLEGRIKYETYEKDGETKYSTKIVADRVEFLDSAGGSKKEEEADGF
jgi:single-strand DNA-binding protein